MKIEPNTRKNSDDFYRSEDMRLLQGRACFTDDVHLDRMVHAAFVRSPIAHARVTRIDASAALAAGALLVLTADDLPFGGRDFVLRYANAHIRGGLTTLLARERVRYVGEPIAMVVAADRYFAEDYAAMVEVEFEALPAIADTESAQKSDAAPLHDSWHGNVAADFSRRRGDPEVAMAAAPRRLKRRFSYGRQSPLPLETRGCVSDFDVATQSLRHWSSSQVHYPLRQNLAAMLDLSEQQVRVIAEDVGGGFGSKSRPYIEDIVVSHASRVLNRPVKWIEDRFEHLQATTQSRGIETELEIGYDEQGQLLALAARLVVDIGAYVFTSGIITAEVAAATIAGAYRIRNVLVDVVCVGTNKTPLATYRGAGQPESALPLECLLELVARDLSITATELRRRNVLRQEDLPFASWIPIGDEVGEIESGDYPRMLEILGANSGYNEVVERNSAGELLAWGMACGFELTGLINYESARIRVGPDGKVIVWSGLCSQGQGQYTTFARVCADGLGVPVEAVTVRMGDTDMLAFGRGAFASRGAVVGANAVFEGARLLADQALQHAAQLLKRQANELKIQDGHICLGRKGTKTGLTLADVAKAVSPGGSLFSGAPGLEIQHVFDTGNKLTFALAIHAARVAVDPDTGLVRVVDYYVVHDAGRELNPMVVEGQVLGGVADGIGCTLLSEHRYDEEGQLLTGTLADYLVATATEVPRIRLGHLSTLATTNPLGVRGVGESGVIAAAPTIANAVARAINPRGIDHQAPLFYIPLRPAAVLASLDASRHPSS